METGQEHPIWHSRCALHGDVRHSLCHIIGKIEGLPSREGVHHVAKAKIDMVSVSYGANDVGTKDLFPFLELG